MRSTYVHRPPLEPLDSAVAMQVEHILGRSVSDYRATAYGADDTFLVGRLGGNQFSEFHFGAGESSIIRMITKIEHASENSLILIEEIENGLHPVATRRMVEYLIDVAARKSIQAIFTTHSDYALAPLPNEGIWASIDGKLRQGKLSVEALRAVSGRVDKRLAVFVEDNFAKVWVEAILRKASEPITIRSRFMQYKAMGMLSRLIVGTWRILLLPSSRFASSMATRKQREEPAAGVIRLPGTQPELAVFEAIRSRLSEDLAILTVSCQRAPEAQDQVYRCVEEVARTNRDPHLLFNQLGMKIGFVPEAIVRGAFLALWVRSHSEFCRAVAEEAKRLIETQL